MATLTINRQQELVSVSDATRRLAGLLQNLRNHVASKFFITKNNTIEAVLLPIDEYEKLLDLEEELDRLMLHQEILLREKRDTGKRISLAELDEQYDQES